MATLAEELGADIADAISGYEQSFEWSGRAIPCVRNTGPAGAMDKDGGFVEGASFSLLVASAQFENGDAPIVGDLIDNSAAQIKRIDPNIAQLVIYAGSPDE